MANLWYPKFLEAQWAGTYDLTTAVVRAVLIDTGTYTYSAAHDFYNDLSGVVGAESPAFASKTFTNGVFDAADITFSAVTGATAEALVIFIDTGNVATDALVAYIDSATSGLPATPNSGDINIVWNGSGIGTL